MIRRRRTALLLPVLLVSLLLLGGCGAGSKKSGDDTAGSGPCKYTKDGTKAARTIKLPSGTPPATAPSSMVISTDAGDIPITFEAEQAPCAVNSFISLATQGYFDKTPCHRLTTEGYYVLQCGDPLGTGQGGPGYTFADELVDNDPRLQPCGSSGGQAYCTYGTGTVAMVNRGPGTNGSQFFMVYGSSRFPPDFTVFGHLNAAGLKVIKSIAAKGIGKPSGMGPGDGEPKQPVTITSVK